MICSIITLLRFIGGILCTSTLAIGGYFYIYHYDDLDCGNIEYGIALGLTSIIVFLFNILTYMSSCNKIWIIWLCGLFLIGATIYNIYVTYNIDSNCKKNYEDKNIWEYYIYMYISMIILSIIFIVFTLINLCSQDQKT